MASTPQQNKQIFEWPRWVEIYAVVISAPMAIISIALGAWLVVNYGGEIRQGAVTLGFIFLFVAYILSFLMAGLLFYGCTQRVFTKQSEALNFASLAHLMVLTPAGTLLLLSFVRQQQLFVQDFNDAIDAQTISFDMVLLVWVILHVFSALFLSLSDNTSRFVE